MSRSSFDVFFSRAVGSSPFPYQREFAKASSLPQIIDVPTGLGKTAMVVIGWLWRRFGGGAERNGTPRRLVYCLPMRVLVEQTADSAREWINKLKTDGRFDNDGPSVHVLMGGEDEDEWDIHPEREAILVGTQDMLLSRALNRGYAASRARWPLQFGLLHTDCLWVFDEIQLMGAGLATAAQLEAFRKLGHPNGHGCHSVWMSATMQRGWLGTVDFGPFLEKARDLTFDFEKEINADGLDDRARRVLEDRWSAGKPLARAEAHIGETAALAQEVYRAHKPGTRTIVVVNTVRRSCELFDALKAVSDGISTKARKTRKMHDSEKDAKAPPASEPRIVLLHSRFRPEDRKDQVRKALAEIEPDAPGTIVVSTQVIEAGVDVSSTTLFAELAPWASLVQRFGRCNRKGEANAAQVWWISLPSSTQDAKQMAALAAPYELRDLAESAKRLKELTDVGLRSLPDVSLLFERTHVIRRKDLIDLFDTTPDLAGNDIDIDRFVREVEDSDVRVFWRDWDQQQNQTPLADSPAPRREELCPVPIGSDKHPGFRQFAKKHGGKVWRWSFLDKKWEKANADKIAPGQVFLVHDAAGGYSPGRGWDPDEPGGKISLPLGTKTDPPEATDDERLSRIGVWQTVAQHTDDLCQELDAVLASVSVRDDEADALRHAARWHDRGKVHVVFQNAIDDGQVVQRQNKTVTRRQRPKDWSGCRFIAKAPGKVWKDGRVVEAGWWRQYDWPAEGREHFRHELASALAVLLSSDGPIPAIQRDLVAYLVAAHHGKVRLSVRSLPNESRPAGGRRFARGVWDDDSLPATDLGDGVTAPAVVLSLEPMELGLCEHEPFTGQPSWAERMINLRDRLGPFHLAHLEAMLRAADMRASRAAEQREAEKRKREAPERGRETPRG